MRQRRRLADMVVPRGDQNAAVPRRARGVAVLQRVAGTVDAGPLAVPEPEHAVVAGAGERARLLRAPDRRRGEILVQPRLEADIGRIEKFLRAPQLAVEPAERRASIAGDEARRRKPGRAVAVTLRQQQANDRLQPGDEQRAALLPIALVQTLYSAHPLTVLPCGNVSNRTRPIIAVRRPRCTPHFEGAKVRAPFGRRFDVLMDDATQAPRALIELENTDV